MSSRSGRCIMSDQYLLKTLENAIDVLFVFETEVSLTPKEIKERTKMNRTTLFRILYTLRHEGILQLDAHTGEYSIGMKIIHLASLSLQRIDIKNISQSHLQLLRSEEHTSELQSRGHLVCRLLLEKKKTHQ